MSSVAPIESGRAVGVSQVHRLVLAMRLTACWIWFCPCARSCTLFSSEATRLPRSDTLLGPATHPSASLPRSPPILSCRARPPPRSDGFSNTHWSPLAAHRLHALLCPVGSPSHLFFPLRPKMLATTSRRPALRADLHATHALLPRLAVGAPPTGGTPIDMCPPNLVSSASFRSSGRYGYPSMRL